MSRTSPKYIMYQLCDHHAQHLCTSTMYINIMQCAKRHHPWNVSIICLYQYANMCIYQYANHVHPPICQPCESTNMPTMCIYQYAKQRIISLMICLHHEPSATIMYLKQIPIVVLIKQYQWCSIIKHMPSMSVPNMYTTMHQYHKMMNPIHVFQILHKTCDNQPASRCLYQCTRNVPIMHQLQIINDVQHDHLINSPTICPNVQPIHIPNACIKIFNKYALNTSSIYIT